MCVLKALRLKGTATINAIGLTAAIEISGIFFENSLGSWLIVIFQPQQQRLFPK